MRWTCELHWQDLTTSLATGSKDLGENLTGNSVTQSDCNLLMNVGMLHLAVGVYPYLYLRGVYP